MTSKPTLSRKEIRCAGILFCQTPIRFSSRSKTAECWQAADFANWEEWSLAICSWWARHHVARRRYRNVLVVSRLRGILATDDRIGAIQSGVIVDVTL